jgi:hypothetical protein
LSAISTATGEDLLLCRPPNYRRYCAGEAAAAGLALAAAFDFLCFFDFVAADGDAIATGLIAVAGLAPAEAFAFFLHRYTLLVEMLRSVAMSWLFLPAATSDITLSQSTLFA